MYSSEFKPETHDEAVKFLDARLAYLRSLHLMDRLPKDRQEIFRLGTILVFFAQYPTKDEMPVRPSFYPLLEFYKDNYANQDAYVPDEMMHGAA